MACLPAWAHDNGPQPLWPFILQHKEPVPMAIRAALKFVLREPHTFSEKDDVHVTSRKVQTPP